VRRSSYRLTEVADSDVEAILNYTNREFGPHQRDRYAILIDKAAEMVAENPARPGSRARDDLAPGVRSFHLDLAARRRGAAAHILYYLLGKIENGRDGVIIARILHEAMEPARYIAARLGH
jgi:toxin ParE1/3/4